MFLPVRRRLLHVTHVGSAGPDEWALINPKSSVVTTALLYGLLDGAQASLHPLERRAVEALCVKQQTKQAHADE